MRAQGVRWERLDRSAVWWDSRETSARVPGAGPVATRVWRPCRERRAALAVGSGLGCGEQTVPAGRWPCERRRDPVCRDREGSRQPHGWPGFGGKAPSPARLEHLRRQLEAVSSRTWPGFVLTPWLGSSWDRQGQFRQPDSLASSGPASRRGCGGCGGRVGLWAPGPGQPWGSWRPRGAGGPGKGDFADALRVTGCHTEWQDWKGPLTSTL